MSNRTRNGVSLLIAVALTAANLAAAVVPGRWEKVDTLQPGTAIIVFLRMGDRLNCQFSSSSNQELTLTEVDGRSKVIPKSEVDRVLSAKTDDGNANGTLIGLGIGAVGGAVMGAIAAAELDWITGGAMIIFGGIGAGVGALTGYAVDNAVKRQELLYEAQ